LARRAKHLTTTARMPHRWNFVHDEIGYNYRLPNLNAALGCAQLEQVPAMISRKRRLAERYADAFAGIEGVRFLTEPNGSRSNYWLNTIVLDPRYADRHETVLAVLNDANYMSRPVWTLMHRLPMYAACPRADVRTAESLASRVVNIPSSPKLAD
jgi:perosamine synthetase